VLPVLPTSLVGSYAQPEWLIDRAKLAGRFPPRVRAKELWRVEPALLAQAQDDATQLAIRAQERAGLDLLTDGEIRRESYRDAGQRAAVHGGGEGPRGEARPGRAVP
jgi:5-methyltetrahydropteroyltriglutamate--homocysteine methyltransferase